MRTFLPLESENVLIQSHVPTTFHIYSTIIRAIIAPIIGDQFSQLAHLIFTFYYALTSLLT